MKIKTTTGRIAGSFKRLLALSAFFASVMLLSSASMAVACETDADCADDESCQEVVIGGGCYEDENGEVICEDETAWECVSEGGWSECETDADCGEGQICQEYIAGGGCWEDENGEVMCEDEVGYECITPGEWTECETSADCAEGFVCVESGAGGGCWVDENGNEVCEDFTYYACQPEDWGGEWSECDSDADCGEGEVCEQYGMGTCYVDENGEEICDEETYGECIRPPMMCETDADCPGVLTCVEASSPGVPCSITPDGEEECGEPGGDPAPPERYCAYVPIDCGADSDCPDGFECHSWDDGGGVNNSGCAEPPPCPPGEECDEEPNCGPGMEEPSGGAICLPREIECVENSDCPSEWTCETISSSSCTDVPMNSGSPDPMPCTDEEYNVCIPPGWHEDMSWEDGGTTNNGGGETGGNNGGPVSGNNNTAGNNGTPAPGGNNGGTPGGGNNSGAPGNGGDGNGQDGSSDLGGDDESAGGGCSTVTPASNPAGPGGLGLLLLGAVVAMGARRRRR